MIKPIALIVTLVLAFSSAESLRGPQKAKSGERKVWDEVSFGDHTIPIEFRYQSGRGSPYLTVGRAELWYQMAPGIRRRWTHEDFNSLALGKDASGKLCIESFNHTPHAGKSNHCYYQYDWKLIVEEKNGGAKVTASVMQTINGKERGTKTFTIDITN